MKLYKYLLVFLFCVPNVHASELKNEALHTALIKTAIDFDVFNQKCRGVSLAKKTARVNRLLLDKYDLTVNNYIKEYLSRDPRQAKKMLQKKMVRKILSEGGCRKLKEAGTRQKFRNKYRDLYLAAEQSLWTPQTTRQR